MSRKENSAFATTVSVLAVLAGSVAFCLFFTVFLLIPFFIFMAGAIALVISERQAKAAKSDSAPPTLPPQQPANALPQQGALPQQTGARR